MSRIKSSFQCQACGYTAPKWIGKCPDCGAWNSFVEERESPKSLKGSFTVEKLQPLNEIVSASERRMQTGIAELDRVLGGGLVAGAVILIGGDPGIGKSTLLLQAVSSLAERTFRTSAKLSKPQTILYVSGEESPEQIKLRAERLSINSPHIILFPETLVENIIETSKKLNPAVVVIDSIQTIYTEELSSAPGSVSQIRDSASKLMTFAKKNAIPVFLIGHVTKEGSIAGPRVLEHLVDTVLYFEGDKGHAYRIIRSIKNRFGSTNEIGVFTMTDSGLSGIDNPSELFLSERTAGISGSTVIASIEGTRPLLVELQALVSPTTFGIPRRTSMGVDFNRVNLLIAVLEKKAGIQLGGMDVFINIVGGLKVNEPASDLGIIASLISSFREIPIDRDTFFFGEVGLSGEIRAVSMAEQRIREAAKIGFKKAIIPEGNRERLRNDFELMILGVKNVQEIVEFFRS